MATLATDFVSLLSSVFHGKPARGVARMLSQKLSEQFPSDAPPVDPSAFLVAFGVRLLEWTIPTQGFLTTAGRLRDHAHQFPWVGSVPEDLRNSDPSAPIIVVHRPRHPVTPSQRRRQRVVTMHEFAHWYLRELIRKSIPEVQFRHNDPDEEMLCNLIAADLLIPSSLFSKDVLDPESLVRQAVHLTNKYDVPLFTLLVKAAASLENFAAFALFGRRCESTRICFATPVRSETVFRSECIQRGVMRTFDLDCPQREAVRVKVGGRTRELDACHVPLDRQRQVLSFVYAQPFMPRVSLTSGSAHA